MKSLILFLSLLVAAPIHAHYSDDDINYDIYSACVECDCPADCDCRKPGGTCPASGPCACDCPCKDKAHEKYATGPGFYVHPELREQLDQNVKLAPHGIIRRPSEPEFIVDSHGQKNFLGYKPTWDQYRNAKFIRLRPWEGRTAGEELPKRFNAMDCGVSPVRGQECGDCWAQATISTHEANVSCADHSSKIFSVQDIIDNSGFGSCGGGNLAGEFLKRVGAVLEINYPYKHGRNGGKHPNLTREPEMPVEVVYLRGADGGWPTKEEFKRAHMEFGPALGICGSASSLGDGGRVPNPGRGSTNHCYASYGWDETDFFDVKNSWGDCNKNNPLSNGRCWGDKGHGYYPWGKGSWVTEIQVMFYKKPKPKEPVVVNIDARDLTATITVQPESVLNAADVEKKVREIIANVEEG